MRNAECGIRNAYTSEASIKVLSVKMLFDFHKLRSSLFVRTVSLGSSMRNEIASRESKQLGN